MSGWTTLRVPDASRASPQASRKCERGSDQVAAEAVSSARSPRTMRSFAFAIASANLMSAGASKAGLPPSTTRVVTDPASSFPFREASDASDGSAACKGSR